MAVRGFFYNSVNKDRLTQNGRVGKVALQTAYGQLHGEELQYGVGYTEVAL